MVRVSKLRHHVFPPKINAWVLCIHVLCKTQRSFIRSFYVAKCNLGKVNLEAMLVSSFPSYTRSGPMPLTGAPRDLHTQLLACSSSQSVVAIACCLRASLCFGFCLLAVSDCTMTTRWTNNSLAASLDRENLPSDTLLQAELSVPSLPASAANSLPQSSSTVSAPVVAAGVHDPALITVIVDAVKASLAAERGPGSTSSNLRGNSVSMELQAASGGIPAPSPSLSQQTATFLASEGAFPEQQAVRLILLCHPLLPLSQPHTRWF